MFEKLQKEVQKTNRIIMVAIALSSLTIVMSLITIVLAVTTE